MSSPLGGDFSGAKQEYKMKIFLFMLVTVNQAMAVSLENLSSLKDSDYVKLHSAVVDHDYHVYIKTPPQAADETDKKWPVVYLLDGGNTFPMFVPYAKYMTFFEEIPPLIIVGISYGTDDWRQGNNRSTDFTLPAQDRAHYGGAEKFHQFLATELIPMVEDKYPADPEQRILFGHSLGGQFSLYTAMFQPQTFSGIIASNPAIHRNTALFLGDIQATTFQPRLFIMQADKDNAEYQTPRKKWLDYWQEKPHHWQVQVMTAQGHNHMSSITTAFRQGMVWLFPKVNQ
ncbi:MAG: hypothetical protein DHS20C09_21900 [marine bacterium B5-7]|nr:MAG: hypothetical protein DHS20C09_21900 [marine bacterium B5-7]